MEESCDDPGIHPGRSAPAHGVARGAAGSAASGSSSGTSGSRASRSPRGGIDPCRRLLRHNEHVRFSPARVGDAAAGEVPAGESWGRWGDPTSCPICLEAVQPEGKAAAVPCAHAYCVRCIARWLEIERTCPLCKREVCGVVTRDPRAAALWDELRPRALEDGASAPLSPRRAGAAPERSESISDAVERSRQVLAAITTRGDGRSVRGGELPRASAVAAAAATAGAPAVGRPDRPAVRVPGPLLPLTRPSNRPAESASGRSTSSGSQGAVPASPAMPPAAAPRGPLPSWLLDAAELAELTRGTGGTLAPAGAAPSVGAAAPLARTSAALPRAPAAQSKPRTMGSSVRRALRRLVWGSSSSSSSSSSGGGGKKEAANASAPMGSGSGFVSPATSDAMHVRSDSSSRGVQALRSSSRLSASPSLSSGRRSPLGSPLPIPAGRSPVAALASLSSSPPPAVVSLRASTLSALEGRDRDPGRPDTRALAEAIGAWMETPPGAPSGGMLSGVSPGVPSPLASPSPLAASGSSRRSPLLDGDSSALSGRLSLELLLGGDGGSRAPPLDLVGGQLSPPTPSWAHGAGRGDARGCDSARSRPVTLSDILEGPPPLLSGDELATGRAHAPRPRSGAHGKGDGAAFSPSPRGDKAAFSPSPRVEKSSFSARASHALAAVLVPRSRAPAGARASGVDAAQGSSPPASGGEGDLSRLLAFSPADRARERQRKAQEERGENAQETQSARSRAPLSGAPLSKPPPKGAPQAPPAPALARASPPPPSSASFFNSNASDGALLRAPCSSPICRPPSAIPSPPSPPAPPASSRSPSSPSALSFSASSSRPSTPHSSIAAPSSPFYSPAASSPFVPPAPLDSAPFPTAGPSTPSRRPPSSDAAACLASSKLSELQVASPASSTTASPLEGSSPRSQVSSAGSAALGPPTPEGSVPSPPCLVSALRGSEQRVERETEAAAEATAVAASAPATAIRSHEGGRQGGEALRGQLVVGVLSPDVSSSTPQKEVLAVSSAASREGSIDLSVSVSHLASASASTSASTSASSSSSSSSSSSPFSSPLRTLLLAGSASPSPPPSGTPSPESSQSPRALAALLARFSGPESLEPLAMRRQTSPQPQRRACVAGAPDASGQARVCACLACDRAARSKGATAADLLSSIACNAAEATSSAPVPDTPPRTAERRPRARSANRPGRPAALPSQDLGRSAGVYAATASSSSASSSASASAPSSASSLGASLPPRPSPRPPLPPNRRLQAPRGPGAAPTARDAAALVARRQLASSVERHRTAPLPLPSRERAAPAHGACADAPLDVLRPSPGLARQPTTSVPGGWGWHRFARRSPRDDHAASVATSAAAGPNGDPSHHHHHALGHQASPPHGSSSASRAASREVAREMRRLAREMRRAKDGRSRYDGMSSHRDAGRSSSGLGSYRDAGRSRSGSWSRDASLASANQVAGGASHQGDRHHHHHHRSSSKDGSSSTRRASAPSSASAALRDARRASRDAKRSASRSIAASLHRYSEVELFL